MDVLFSARAQNERGKSWRNAIRGQDFSNGALLGFHSQTFLGPRCARRLRDIVCLSKGRWAMSLGRPTNFLLRKILAKGSTDTVVPSQGSRLARLNSRPKLCKPSTL